MEIGLNSDELWDSLEVKLIEIKSVEGIDPILVDKIDAVINHYNGGLSRGYKDNALGKIEVLVKVLTSKEYYKTRGMETSIINKLADLADELDLFRKVVINEIRTQSNDGHVDMYEYNNNAERLPSLEAESDKIEKLYKDNKARPRLP